MWYYFVYFNFLHSIAGYKMYVTKNNLWSISLNITATSIYRPNANNNPAITAIPPMVRRRLSPLARMVFQVASTGMEEK
jgi:uncharacterized membrane protein